MKESTLPVLSYKQLRPPLSPPPTLYHDTLDGERIAYIHYRGQENNDLKNIHRTSIYSRTRDFIEEDDDITKPKSGILFLPGFRSKMRSTKSQALFEYCYRTSREFTTLDYYGHGESSGGEAKMKKVEKRKEDHQLKKGTISRWTDDVLTILDSVTCSSKQIIVGSSMGSWIMINTALSRIDRIGALVGIGAAPDFTTLISKQIYADPELSKQMHLHGYCDIPSSYDESGFYRIYKELLIDGKKHFLLCGRDTPISLIDNDNDIPLVLIHGKKDIDISWKYSEQLLQNIKCQEKKLILVEEGDHRLSSSDDLDIILNAIGELV